MHVCCPQPLYKGIARMQEDKKAEEESKQKKMNLERSEAGKKNESQLPMA